MTTEDIAQRCRLQIMREVNFGSDHYGLSLLMKSWSRPKAKEMGEKEKQYIWTEEGKARYERNLNENVRLRDIRAHTLNVLSPNVAETQRPNHRTVDKMVEDLTETILEACEAELEYKERGGERRGNRRRGENSEISKAIQGREESRREYEKTVERKESQEIRERRKKEYERARETVRKTFREVTERRNKKTWEKMEKTWGEDKADFFHEFSELAGLHPKQKMPRSLRVNGEEVRRPGKIRKEWRNRFQISHVETGKEEDKRYREETEEKNERRGKEKTHENAMFNRDYEIREVLEAMGKGKLKKRTGRDRVQNEMMKWGGKKLHECLRLLFNVMHRAERIAGKWKTTPFGPMYKKGDVRNALNFRPVTYMSNIYKTYERCIDVRVRG